jgi:hypothetical protein
MILQRPLTVSLEDDDASSLTLAVAFFLIELQAVG